MDKSPIGAKHTFKQNVTFKGSEREYCAEIVSSDVKVQCSAGNHNHGSSKVKLTNVVDYNWEMRYYIGQLLAVHIGGKVIAYGIKGKTGGMVRILNLDTNKRMLLKEMKGLIHDISFALIPQQLILGFVDEEGSLYVYNIEDGSESITCSLLLHVLHPTAIHNPASNYRVIWCPYIPSYGEDSDTLDDPAKLLVLLNGNKAEIWDVSVVNSRYGEGPLQPHEKYEGYVEISGHLLDVIDASFSPDGTALATASLDGYVKFFQVYMVENEQPRCLHEWQPHDGKALSCLLFLDNVRAYGPDSRFWKFAVTGASHNSELKVWSCESWTCLQKIHFEPNPNSCSPQLFFKARLDMTGHYLLLSDINNRTLFILRLIKNDDKRQANVSSISEFLLPAPFLSFCITSADVCKYSLEDLYREEADLDDDLNVKTITIQAYVVQPKRLQVCNITFCPDTSICPQYHNSVEDVINGEAQNKIEIAETKSHNLEELQSSLNLLQSLNLMTPEAFNSPGRDSSPTAKQNSLGSGIATPKLNDEIKVVASGGSSPSREVQEILSLNTSNYSSHFDNFDKDETETTDFNQTETNDPIWPNIPIMKADEILKEESRRLVASDDSELKWQRTQLEALNFRLASLELLMRGHFEHLNAKGELKDEVRATFVEELDVALAKSQLQYAKMFESYVNVQKNRDREHQENIIGSMSQLLNKQVGDKLHAIISHEIKHIILPSIMNTFENLKHQLTIEYTQKLNTTDHLLKENISKLISSKLVADSLSLSVVSVIKPSLEQCYKDMIGTTLIPSWERVCNSMFQQIHDTFTQGTKEYTASVESYMDRQRRVQDKGKDLIAQMQNVSEVMKNNSDKLTANLTLEIQKQFTTSFSSMQDKLTSSIINAINEQVKLGFKSHVSVLEDSVMNAVRSRAVTPSPHVYDAQAQLVHIQQLLAKGNIDVAFQQALSASDLSLVVYVCEKVNPQEVFGDKCRLPQHVLLSLIQQLGADMVHQTELKYRYLEDAVLNLDPHNGVAKEHIPIVLKELMKHLSNFIVTNPNHKNIRKMKMLQLAVQSLLKA